MTFYESIIITMNDSASTTARHSSDPAEALGLYIHIPFCVKKCGYCDFYSLTDLRPVKDFATAVKKELPMAAGRERPAVDTVYIGGGTPSVLAAEQIAAMIEAAGNYFSLKPDAEITVEANPDSADRPWLEAARRAGVNRINIGVQSFSDAELSFLGRVHSAAQAAAAVEAARESGFDNIGLDVIYGLPGQTKRDLRKTLSRALALEPAHLSCYMLTCEPGTPLAGALAKGEFRALPEAAASDLFLFTADFLAENNFEWYEISNFSRGSRTRSRHNSKYWRRRPYIGLGPAAHSCNGRQRSWNVSHLEQYLDHLKAGRRPQEAAETLTRAEHMTEAVYLSLRLAEGLDISAFEQEFEVDFSRLFAAPMASLQAAGLLEISAGHCRLSPRGMLFHETVAAAFTDLI